MKTNIWSLKMAYPEPSDERRHELQQIRKRLTT